MPRFEFAYGTGSVALDIDGAREIVELEPRNMPPIEDVGAALVDALETGAIGAEPLSKRLFPGDEVTIVVSDITRHWMRQDRVVAPLVKYLNALGIPDSDIAVLVATGTHRGQTEGELRALVTDDVFDRVRVVEHDCDAPDLVYVGTTSRGTPVRVNPLVAKRKTIILGGTVHHLLAGYGGGRKSIVPGVAARDTVNKNHLMSLDPTDLHSDPRVGLGRTAENPVHLDMAEAARLAKPLFGINLVVDGDGRLCEICAGDPEKAWEASCRRVDALFGIEISRRADVVVASCGGFPKDINLYQSVKTLVNAAQAVRDGGTLYFIAECREGGGAKSFFDWVEPLKRGTIVEELRAGFTIAGYIFFAFVELMRNFDVKMLTSLPGEVLAPMGIEALSTVEAFADAIDVSGKSVYIMRRGGNTVPRGAAR